MRSLPATPAFWLALLSVLASAGLWIWSRSIPASVWETAVPLAGNVPPTAHTSPSDASGDAAAPRSGEEPATAVPAVPAAAASPTPPVSPDAASTIAATSSPSGVPANTPAPSPTPTPPSEAELTGPLPQHSGNEPSAPALGTGPAVPVPPPSTTAAATASTPALLPAPLDIASLAQQPERWPRQVLLLAPVRFPVILKGINAGNIQVPAGSPVLLRKINPDGSVEIELPAAPGSIAKVKAQATDLLARARAAAAAAQANPVAAPAAASPGTPNPPIHPVP